MKKIPCLINNFNQLEYLIPMVDKLSSFDNLSLYILDNNSTYEPLLKWYHSLANTKIQVIKLGRNSGHMAPWSTHLTHRLAREYRSPYYIVSDPDLDISLIPEDTIHLMIDVLTQREIFKVGLSIEIEDLPEHYPLKNEVTHWESPAWSQERKETYKNKTLYRTGIDTTFAMYNIFYTEAVYKHLFFEGGIKFNCNFINTSLRLDRPYTARHLPWYLDYNALTENQKFHTEICKKSDIFSSSSWTQKALQHHSNLPTSSKNRIQTV